MDYTQYIKPELLFLILILCGLGKVLKTTPRVKDWMIPYILGGVSIFLCGIWVSATEGVNPLSIFTAITQGVLIAGASIGGNQLVRQYEKRDE